MQGVGAAAFVPASLSLLISIFARDEERNRAVGIYGGMAALGFVVGMVGGGVITDLLGWRWVLFVNVPVALVALLVTPAAVPESRGEGSEALVGGLRWGLLVCVGVVFLALPVVLFDLRSPASQEGSSG